MQNLAPTKPLVSRGKLPLLLLLDSLPASAYLYRNPISHSLRCREISRLNLAWGKVRAQASNIGVGSGGYEGREEYDNQKVIANGPPNDGTSEIRKPPSRFPYPISIAIVLFGCALVFSLIAFVKGGPTSVLAAIAKSGFTAVFSLIFVSEIGYKTFFIAHSWPCNMRKDWFFWDPWLLLCF